MSNYWYFKDGTWCFDFEKKKKDEHSFRMKAQGVASKSRKQRRKTRQQQKAGRRNARP